MVFPSLLLRKAAGSVAFDFAQLVPFAVSAAATRDRPLAPYPRNISTPNPNGRKGGSGGGAGDAAQCNPMHGGCVVPVLPSGFVFKLVILATHGVCAVSNSSAGFLYLYACITQVLPAAEHSTLLPATLVNTRLPLLRGAERTGVVRRAPARDRYG